MIASWRSDVDLFPAFVLIPPRVGCSSTSRNNANAGHFSSTRRQSPASDEPGDESLSHSECSSGDESSSHSEYSFSESEHRSRCDHSPAHRCRSDDEYSSSDRESSRTRPNLGAEQRVHQDLDASRVYGVQSRRSTQVASPYNSFLQTGPTTSAFVGTRMITASPCCLAAFTAMTQTPLPLMDARCWHTLDVGLHPVWATYIAPSARF